MLARLPRRPKAQYCARKNRRACRRSAAAHRRHGLFATPRQAARRWPVSTGRKFARRAMIKRDIAAINRRAFWGIVSLIIGVTNSDISRRRNSVRQAARASASTGARLDREMKRDE